MSEFGEYAVTRQIEDAIRAIVNAEIRRNRPTCRYAVVEQINTSTRSCYVTFNGDVTMSKVAYRDAVPSMVGQVVAVEGTGIDQYISGVLGPTQTDVNVAAVQQEASGTIAWNEISSYGSGASRFSANPAMYRKVRIHGTDFIQWRGRINTTASAVLLTNMPTGYRPIVNLAPILVGRGFGGGSNVAQLDVLASGAIQLVGKTTGANSGATSSAGNSATTGNIVNFDHNHKFLNLDWGTTDAYRNADSFNKYNANSTHTHTAPAHTHDVPSVTAPDFISLDGVQYAI